MSKAGKEPKKAPVHGRDVIKEGYAPNTMCGIWPLRTRGTLAKHGEFITCKNCLAVLRSRNKA